MRIHININVHENHVLTAVRFYCNPQVYVEYCVNDISAPLKLMRYISENEMARHVVDYVREKTNECGKAEWNNRTLEGLEGCLSISLETVWMNQRYAPLDVKEARHIRLSKNGGGKDLMFAFDGKFKDAILKNIFTKVYDKDVTSLNKIFEGLRL